MIGWITEPGRRSAIRLNHRRTGFVCLNQECSIYQTEGEYYLRLPFGIETRSNPKIGNGAVTEVFNPETGASAKICWSFYDRGYEEFRRVSWQNGTVTLGNSIDDDIYVQDRNLKGRQFVFKQNEQMVTDRADSGIGDLSGKPVTENRFQTGDRFRVLNVQVILFSDFLAVSCTANTYCSLPEIKLEEKRMPEPEVSFVLKRTYQEPVQELHYEIDLAEPAPLEQTKNRPLIFMMGPILMMSSASLATGLLSAYNAWMNGRNPSELIPMIILPAVMVLSALIWNPLQRVYEVRSYTKRRKARTAEYEQYLDSVIDEVRAWQQAEYEHRERRFPAVPSGRENLWRALPYHADFLSVRIGNGRLNCHVTTVKSFRCPAGDTLPELIGRKLSGVSEYDMPYILNIRSYHSIAVSYTDRTRGALIGLFLQFLYYHGPDVVHVIFVISDECEQRNPWIRNIPHVYRRDGMRSIVTSLNQAADTAAAVSAADYSGIVIICLRPALPDVFKDFEASVIYPVCGSTVPADAECRIYLNDQSVTVTDSSLNAVLNYDKKPIPSFKEYCALFDRCIIRPERHEADLSETFFDLYQSHSIRELDIGRRWRSTEYTDKLTARIGKGDDGEIIELDLSEQGNGPHGLIAGMTGSGKSELIITLLLSLCISYSPREFQFVLVDFKGGGAAGLFSNNSYRVKHAAGLLSNLDEADTERALVSFQNECIRRERLFSELSRRTSKPVMNLKSYQNEWSEDCGLPYLASLLIIVDEFAELKKEQPEVMRDLISVARVGRSLGIHMILATQKPGGIVDEQIWSNCRFKICLKVQDKADSNEMIQSSDAAWIRRAGEAYLLCDGVRMHLQCGYANAPAAGREKKIQLLDAYGNVTREQFWTIQNSTTQSEQVIAEICREQESYPAAHQLWCDPLGHVTRTDLPNEKNVWIGITDDYRIRQQNPRALHPGVCAVFSVDRNAKCSFLRTLLAGLLETAGPKDQIFIIDDLHVFESDVTDCGTICACITSRQQELVVNLLRYLNHREAGAEEQCCLIITDTGLFYECDEEYRGMLRTLITKAEITGLRIIAVCSSASTLSYRDLSVIRERIALKNESLQDLASIFEQPVHHRITKENAGLCFSPGLCDLCLLETGQDELREAVQDAAQRLGTEKKYTIPSMPAEISVTEYTGNMIPAGIDIATYQWAEIPQNRTLFVLSTYEEELYSYYETMKTIVQASLFLPSEEDVRNTADKEHGVWIFLTLEQFQMYGLSQKSAPVLYIGTGFRDQYRFTSRYKKDLKQNQGILFWTGKNCVIQLIERGYQ